MWIARLQARQQNKLRRSKGLADRPEAAKLERVFLVALLIVHLVAGLGASVADWALPFSASKATAAFITSRQMDRMPIAADVDHAASAVAGYLGRRIYYPRGDRMGSFVIWDKTRSNTTADEVLKRLKEFSDRQGRDVLLVMNYQLVDSGYPEVPIAEFTASVVAREEYYLYLLSGEGREQQR